MGAHRVPLIVGIVNVTPDSFSDGGAFAGPGGAIEYGLKLVEEGAAIIEIGGESTRPGAEPTPEREELARVLPVVKGLAAQTAAAIAIDTRKPSVARACIEVGASIWNDVSALSFAPGSLATAAALDCRVVLMHCRGEPRTMQALAQYVDVVEEVFAELDARLAACDEAGVSRAKIIVDPGIGFGKTLPHNLALLAGLGRFKEFGLPIMLGASRKRFIEALDRPGPANERLGGSLAAAIAGAARGASLIRVHDVAATRQALNVYFAIDSMDLPR